MNNCCLVLNVNTTLRCIDNMAKGAIIEAGE